MSTRTMLLLRQTASRFLRQCRFSHKKSTNPISHGAMKYVCQFSSGSCIWAKEPKESYLWLIMLSPAAILIGIDSDPVFADRGSAESTLENDAKGANVAELRRVDDGSVVSNVHTTKWRIFTDNGRDSFLKGQLEQAERFFLSALEEAKKGFGERDSHVASACNNLAELYRVMKAFDKAEPLYLDAIDILKESFSPEDIREWITQGLQHLSSRVGVALHNLGQFYLVQRKLEEASMCYERALKIKGRVLGYGNPDYADTMYHLGMVLHLQGKEKECELLLVDSIRILEEAGQGESSLCIKRLRNLAQMYLKSNRLLDAENVQRKILHILELSKGWGSLETITAAEGLALTMQSTGNLKDAHELLERCLDSRKALLPESHIQIGANMLHIARMAMLNSNELRKRNVEEAIIQLDQAKVNLDNSIRIARQVLSKLVKQRGKLSNNKDSLDHKNEGQSAMIILLQSLDALGLLEITKQELQESREGDLGIIGAEDALSQCISAYKKFGQEKFISDFVEVKLEYLSCLKHLLSLLTDHTSKQWSPKMSLQEVKDEISRVESEISSARRHRK